MPSIHDYPELGCTHRVTDAQIALDELHQSLLDMLNQFTPSERMVEGAYLYAAFTRWQQTQQLLYAILARHAVVSFTEQETTTSGDSPRSFSSFTERYEQPVFTEEERKHLDAVVMTSMYAITLGVSRLYKDQRITVDHVSQMGESITQVVTLLYGTVTDWCRVYVADMAGRFDEDIAGAFMTAKKITVH